MLEPQALEAAKLFNKRQYLAAETLALQLLDLAPNLRPTLRVLFEIRKAQGRVLAAETLARRLAALPGTAALRAAAAMQLAQFLIVRGRYAEAEALAGIGIGNVPARAYLHPDPALVASWGARLERLAPPGKRRIALAWARRPTHKNDRKRSMKLAQFAPLFARDDAAILTVQKGAPVAQTGAY
jgi:hypothetical protein